MQTSEGEVLFMDIVWFRDLIICVWGSVATLLLIFIAVLVFLLYRKAKVVLNSIEMASSTILRISCTVEDEIVKPIAQVVSIIQGVRVGVDFISRLFRRNEGKEGGRYE